MGSAIDNPESSSPRAGGRDAVGAYASYIAISVIGLANVLLISRVLGPTGRGEVVFLMTVASISGYLCNLSVQEANANLASLKAHRRSVLGTNSVLLSIGLGLLAAGVATLALAYAPFLAEDVPTPRLAIALASIPSVTLQIYFVYLARGSYHFTIANLAMLAPPTVALLANAVMAIAGMLTVTTALASWSTGLGISALVLVVEHGRRVGFGRPDPDLASEVVSFGLKSHVGGIFATGSYRMDQWILGAVAGPRELGLYSVAVAWSEGLSLLPTAIAAVARPDLVTAGRREAGRRAAVLFRVTVITTIVLAVTLVVAAPLLCTVIFGADFSGSVTPLRLLAVGSIGIVGAKVIGVALIAQRRPLLESAAMGIGFGVAIALYVSFIPPFGANGAAIASAIAYSVAGASAAVFLVRALSVSAVELIPRPFDVRRLVSLAFRAGTRLRRA